MKRFNLREILLFIAIVAFAISWCVDHRRLTELTEQQQAREMSSFFMPQNHRSLEQCVSDAQVIVVATALDATPRHLPCQTTLERISFGSR